MRRKTYRWPVGFDFFSFPILTKFFWFFLFFLLVRLFVWLLFLLRFSVLFWFRAKTKRKKQCNQINFLVQRLILRIHRKNASSLIRRRQLVAYSKWTFQDCAGIVTVKWINTLLLICFHDLLLILFSSFAPLHRFPIACYVFSSHSVCLPLSVCVRVSLTCAPCGSNGFIINEQMKSANFCLSTYQITKWKKYINKLTRLRVSLLIL